MRRLDTNGDRVPLPSIKRGFWQGQLLALSTCQPSLFCTVVQGRGPRSPFTCGSFQIAGPSQETVFSFILWKASCTQVVLQQHHHSPRSTIILTTALQGSPIVPTLQVREGSAERDRQVHSPETSSHDVCVLRYFDVTCPLKFPFSSRADGLFPF